MSDFACEDLLGKMIGEWKVIKALGKPTNGKTGGTFSICYHVERDGELFFMKVLDYRYVMRSPLRIGETRTIRMEQSTSEFNYEKELSMYCNNKRINKVVRFIDAGECEIDGYLFSTVSYIVYEMARGDIRDFLDFTRKVDAFSQLLTLNDKLKSLHDVSVALQQLHVNAITHQDIKPSNIMSFDEESKIGDLGRSIILIPDIKCPYGYHFNGDYSYAPLEAYLNDVKEQTKYDLYQMDNYMLGGLIAFYITGQSYNALVQRHLTYSLRDMARMGYSYTLALDELVNVHPVVIEEIKSMISIEEIRDGLANIVSELCYPDPQRRGDITTISSTDNNYSLERIITRLDVLQKKAELEIHKLM